MRKIPAFDLDASVLKECLQENVLSCIIQMQDSKTTCFLVDRFIQSNIYEQGVLLWMYRHGMFRAMSANDLGRELYIYTRFLINKQVLLEGGLEPKCVSNDSVMMQGIVGGGVPARRLLVRYISWNI